jgi:cyclopropane-fatty-acyl-phospholipid synthase
MIGSVLSKIIKQGTLTVVWPDGRRQSFGAGEPRSTIRFVGRWTPLALGLHPELRIGEFYMDGRLVIDEGNLEDALKILVMNAGGRKRKLPGFIMVVRKLRRWLRAIPQFNTQSMARANVAHHYDLSSNLYDLFLDADRQYSCAYFQSPKDSLETAQAAKKRHITAKLFLDRKGLKVLDIGSGWGGLALDIARDAEADVLGVTLSSEQLAVAQARASAAGLAERCRFELKDYRAAEGKFDRIVSVGMFEQVGVKYFDTFFGKVRDLLADDGVALLHTIGRDDGPGATNPWISKYIFPGGYVPSLSEIIPSIERAGLVVTDMETLRLHYAETIKAWRQRFYKNWDKAAAIYDQRFCRMWEFYLTVAEMAFRHDGQVVYQLQLARRNSPLPITRDYMVDAERMAQVGGRAHAAA